MDALPRGYKGVVIVLQYMKNMCDWTQVQVLGAVGNGECPTWCECVGTSEAVLKGSKQSSVSAALIREEGKVQKPVYFVSRALPGAEERYPRMEKLAFALVIAARKLKPYFQAHAIIVLTDQPLRRAMNNPEAAGRMALWAIELSEYDIQYQPRTAVQELTTEDDWMIPIVAYLKDGKLPDGKEEARKLKVRAARFILIKGVLYKRGFSRPYLRCLGHDEADYVMREVHEGICGNHSGSRSLVHKLLRAGYYWPTMQKDAHVYVRACDKCQRLTLLMKSGQQRLKDWLGTRT
ncbi:uncharacterized protein LOC142616774 [Castanea sativa]|uniref:uncharacterized protein LOC142616774 n=1 Tax=Castanea sativa TaxID=21020 RepID=UPI003F651548